MKGKINMIWLILIFSGILNAINTILDACLSFVLPCGKIFDKINKIERKAIIVK